MILPGDEHAFIFFRFNIHPLLLELALVGLIELDMSCTMVELS